MRRSLQEKALLRPAGNIRTGACCCMMPPGGKIVQMQTSCARGIRRLRAVLIGLFALAQVAGVLPLIYEHTMDVFVAAQADGARDHVALAGPGADHHHGILDVHDQCCTLHTLAGPLPVFTDVALTIRMGVRITPATALAALADADPARLDRPPKRMPLI
jgi:hypothetical protein